MVAMSNGLYRSIIVVYPNDCIIIGSGSVYSSGRAVQPSYQPYPTGMRRDSRDVVEISDSERGIA